MLRSQREEEHEKGLESVTSNMEEKRKESKGQKVNRKLANRRNAEDTKLQLPHRKFV